MATSSHPPAASTADAFDQSHHGRVHSAVVEQIYRSAFGEDYAADAQPSAFYSATTLQLAVDALQLKASLRSGRASECSAGRSTSPPPGT